MNPSDKVAEATALRTKAAQQKRLGENANAIVLERQANTLITGDATQAQVVLYSFEEPAETQYRERLEVFQKAVLATNDSSTLRTLREQLRDQLPASWKDRSDKNLWYDWKPNGFVDAPKGWHMWSRIGKTISEKLDGTFGAGPRREHPRSKSFSSIDPRPLKMLREEFSDKDL